MEKILDLVSICLLMLITGVFWGTWFTLTRSINSFSFHEFTHIGKVIISNVAVPMRIIMPSGIICILLSLIVSKNHNTTGFYLGIISLFFLIGVLLITVLILVPIDNQIRNWSSSFIPGNWELLRKKWALFHQIRTFGSITSFILYSVSLLSI